MFSFRSRGFGRFATTVVANTSVALILGFGLAGCGGDSTQEGSSSGMAGAIDIDPAKKDEATAGAPKKSAGGLRGQGLGDNAPAKGKR